MKNNCNFCQQPVENGIPGYYPMSMPVPELEELKEKYGGEDWWNNLNRENLTEEEKDDQDRLCFYDQLLFTVGRGICCEKCIVKENELLNKYYPQITTEL